MSVMKSSNPNTVQTKSEKDKTIVLSGRLDQLINYLADESFSGNSTIVVTLLIMSDQEYIEVFLLTHRYFLKPEELFEKLKTRYYYSNVEMPEDMKSEFRPTVQLRVLLVFKIWLEELFTSDFMDNNLLILMQSFIQDEVLKSQHVQLGDILLNTIQRKYMEVYSMDIPALANRLESQMAKTKQHFTGYEICLWMQTNMKLSKESALALCSLLVQENILINTKNKKERKFIPDESQIFSINNVFYIKI